MSEPRRVPAAARAAALLRHLARAGRPLAAAALARELDLPRTSVVGICDALADERMLSRMDDGRFWLGSHVLELAAASAATLERELAVGLLIVSGANPFYAAAIAAAEAELTTGGRLLVRDAAEDAGTQRAQWRELIDEGADVLIVDAVDAATHARELGLAREAGVPVIAIGSRLDGVDASVTSDNTQAGLLAGRRIASELGGSGRIAVLDGLAKNANIDRVAGLREAIRDDHDLTVAAHEQEGHDTTASGERMMRRLLEREERIDAVFTVCDPIAMGAVAALREAGRSVPVVSVDGRGDAIDTILAGGPIIASVAQEPGKILTTAIATARELARGRRTAQGAHLIPVRMIDAQGARGYERWG
ncbi:MAG: substrate-binding domain-containing protein [Microbacterium sp.]